MSLIYHLSDWHALGDTFASQLDFEIRHQKLGQPDLVVLSGDMIRNFRPSRHDYGHEEELQLNHFVPMIDYIDFVWPGVDIFGLRGNHDWCNYEIPGSVKAFDKLEGQSYEWNSYKIHGFRGVGWFHGFWKDEYREDQLKMLCDLVPRDTNILITHNPPEGYLDDVRDVVPVPFDPDNGPQPPLLVPRNIGSPAIRDLVENQLPNLKVHLFGHVHEQGGKVQVRNNKIFSNAACSLNVINPSAMENL
jgi:Icc-related predicted phosphoesterase